MSSSSAPKVAGTGLVCPKCGCRHFFVVYTRPGTRAICRRRECRHCGFRILTRERLWGEDEPAPQPAEPP